MERRCAPKGTPADIVDRLNKEINAGLADATVKARLAEMGASPLPGRRPPTPASSSPTTSRNGPRWFKAGNLKADG